MQYLLMLYSNETGWNTMTPAQQEQGMAAYTAFTEALKNADAHRGSSRLRPTSTATTVRITNVKPQVLDGPYADTKEQLGGYYDMRLPPSHNTRGPKATALYPSSRAWARSKAGREMTRFA
jgi:hypothetical protein